ncbi:MerR-like helix-turn-helix DNA binding domain protein [Arthrobacter phage Andrew]|uniref:MerR-like helix-turn-helix DNA binding domain protein n=1 Tax=Arthrobacter phage Andrew TaxID=2419946 RepID=A0A3G2KD37_9CAUD|nr:MerR-like transcriptional regulator [Arthrobacter phage Andrew]AYN56883.1 MerR-like helix-turn-helix DNA binding domain protein [Arthrobacter phage Andrew]
MAGAAARGICRAGLEVLPMTGVEARPVLVDTLTAAAAGMVSPATVRSWQHRGWLVRMGTGPRNRALYDLEAVYRLAGTLQRGERPEQVGERSA